jgi:hypothetical protein
MSHTRSTPAERQVRRDRRLIRPKASVRDTRIVLTAALTSDEHDLIRQCARTAGWGASSVSDVREIGYHLPGRKIAALIVADARLRANAHHSETTLASLKRIRRLVDDRDIPMLFLLRWHDREYVTRLAGLGVRDIVAVPLGEDLLSARTERFLATLRSTSEQAA